MKPEFKDDGKPTNKYMKWLYENDFEKFEELQGEHFTTKAKMKENPLADYFKKKMKKKD